MLLLGYLVLVQALILGAYHENLEKVLIVLFVRFP